MQTAQKKGRSSQNFFTPGANFSARWGFKVIFLHPRDSASFLGKSISVMLAVDPNTPLTLLPLTPQAKHRLGRELEWQAPIRGKLC